MANKAFRDERGRRNACRFADCAYPQHGGRATTSCRDRGNRGIDTHFLKLLRQGREARPFVGSMHIPELTPIYETYVWKSRSYAFLNGKEYLVAAKYKIPELSDRLSIERSHTRRERSLFYLPLGTWP
ncbi:MAG: hypothetical protein HY525_04435 [Betaproteobacteria bacterium]|nr:hypothetical protein [Betaproteobacteria bacterium]